MGDKADGAGNHGRPASQARITGKNWGLPERQTCILFLKYGTHDWEKGGRKDCVCVCRCFKGLWDLNEDIKSLL